MSTKVTNSFFKSPRTIGFLLMMLAISGRALAATDLALSSPHAKQGSTIEASLEIDTDVSIAGFNAEIIFPAGITVTDVLVGNFLLESGIFILDYVISGQTLRVLAYSANDSLLGTGQLLKLTLNIDAGLLGLKQLDFSASNPKPLINSNHAVSNVNGSESLGHTISSASFLVYSDSSDYDEDDLPDKWEVDNELDPTVDNGDTDTDLDGFTDKEEYKAGTNPRDRNSYPAKDKIFSDGFESK